MVSCVKYVAWTQLLNYLVIIKINERKFYQASITGIPYKNNTPVLTAELKIVFYSQCPSNSFRPSLLVTNFRAKLRSTFTSLSSCHYEPTLVYCSGHKPRPIRTPEPGVQLFLHPPYMPLPFVSYRSTQPGAPHTAFVMTQSLLNNSLRTVVSSCQCQMSSLLDNLVADSSIARCIARCATLNC